MFHKTLLGLAAGAALVTAALAPTTASAHYYGYRTYKPYYGYYYSYRPYRPHYYGYRHYRSYRYY